MVSFADKRSYRSPCFLVVLLGCWLFRLLLAPRTFCRRFRDACVTTIWRNFMCVHPLSQLLYRMLRSPRDYGVVGYPLYPETHSNLWF